MAFNLYQWVTCMDIVSFFRKWIHSVRIFLNWSIYSDLLVSRLSPISNWGKRNRFLWGRPANYFSQITASTQLRGELKFLILSTRIFFESKNWTKFHLRSWRIFSTSVNILWNLTSSRCETCPLLPRINIAYSLPRWCKIKDICRQLIGSFIWLIKASLGHVIQVSSATRHQFPWLLQFLASIRDSGKRLKPFLYGLLLQRVWNNVKLLLYVSW